MAYCQECGSEVAQIDVYCPFCGIALPTSSAKIDAETSQAEVIKDVTAEITPPIAEDNSSVIEDVSANLPSPKIVDDAESWEVTPVKHSEILPIGFKSDFDSDYISPTDETDDLKTPELIANQNQENEIEMPNPTEFVEESTTKTSEDKTISTGELEDKNFDEEFDKLIEPAKEEVLAESEPIDDEKPIIDENIENQTQEEISQEEVQKDVSEEVQDEIKEDLEPQINPFEATIAYTATDVEQLNLADNEVKEEVAATETEVEPIKDEELIEETNAEELPLAEENELSERLETVESQPDVVENEGVLESVAPVIAAPIIAQAVAKEEVKEEAQEKIEEVKERYTSHVGEAVDTGGGKSKLKPLGEGTVLNGRYEIVRKIGGGGMGAVYLASDRNLGGVLRAVKEMVQSHIEEEHQDKAVNDFKRESLLLTSLEHPSIPTIYDYFLDERENRFYLVMKYISGGDLAGRLRSAPENRLDEKTVTEWAIQVADVLDYLHSRETPIVYRDLKPSNVMIDGNSGRVMLIDFGIARWVSAQQEKGVTAVGTMGYAPPELFSGNVEPRSDIYSLGSTMFHLLTGADPQNSPLLIFDFNKNPRPRQINSMLSDQMEQILLRSVEYDADKRFASAAEMREVLINHLDNIRGGKLTFGVSDGISAVGFTSGQLVFCGFCGQKIVSSDMFCPFCGAKQATGQMSASSPIPQSVYNVPSITAKLQLLGTNDLDAVTYNLEKDNNLIGRRDPMSNIFPEVDLSKYDPQTKISRRHSRLWREGDTFMVEDLGSSNGTILLTAFNEQLRLLPHQPRVIAHGDKIKIGDTTLHFVVG